MTIGNRTVKRTLTGAALACSLLAAGTVAAQSVDPEADALLRRMSDYIASMEVFSLEAEVSQEEMFDSGQKVMFIKQAQAAVKRPDKLRIARQGMVVDQEMFFDGKKLTLFGKRVGLYAAVPAGPTIEAVMDFALARDGLGLDLPAADLLSGNAYSILMSDVLSGQYVGATIIDGVLCHQLAFRGGDTDWQIWIDDGARPLPRKYVITSRWITGAPQYTLDFKQWHLNPALTDSTFQFTPPEGAAEIEFLAVIDAPASN